MALLGKSSNEIVPRGEQLRTLTLGRNFVLGFILIEHKTRRTVCWSKKRGGGTLPVWTKWIWQRSTMEVVVVLVGSIGISATSSFRTRLGLCKLRCRICKG
jgi:hypothetical protein